MSKLSLTRRGATTFLLTALLAACGGGGGGDDGPPAGVTADLSAGSYAAASNTAAGSLLGSLDPVLLFAGDASLNAASAGARPLAISRAAVQRLSASRAGERRVGALAVEESTEPCTDGGTVTYINDDADNSGSLSANDTLRVVANNCAELGETVSGSFLITVVRYTVSSSSQTAAYALSFNNFGSTLLRLNGSSTVEAAFTQTSDAVTLRYQGLTASFDGGAVEWRHTVAYSASNSQTVQVSFSGLIAAGNGFVALRQVSPFTLDISTGYPNAGILELTGANGGRVRLVAGSARFTFQFFASGNAGATPDASIPGRVYGS